MEHFFDGMDVGLLSVVITAYVFLVVLVFLSPDITFLCFLE